jgi:hypothetical protein
MRFWSGARRHPGVYGLCLWVLLLLLSSTLQSTTAVSGTHERRVQPAWEVSRLRVATVACHDLESFEQAYTGWLDYELIEKGNVSQALAVSWGAQAMAGREYRLLRPASGADVYIRGVQISASPGYRPMTTLGWNAFEIIVDDIDRLAARLESSPFEILGAPRSLGGSIASVYAMQVLGPAGEILYFNSVKGDRSKSRLPLPGSQVDRLNIAILGAASASEARDFYVQRVGFLPAGSYQMPVSLLARANGLPATTIFELLMVSGSEAGNLVEIDTYPAGARPREAAAGELPPGNAMLSVEVDSLAESGGLFLAEPVNPTGILYSGSSAATLRGPSGELLELISRNH